MSDIFNDTNLFGEEAKRRFVETFESGRIPVPKQPSRSDKQQAANLKQLEVDNANLCLKLKNTERQLNEVAQMKGQLDDSKNEVAQLKAQLEEEKTKNAELKQTVIETHAMKKELEKPFRDEIETLRAKLKEYVSSLKSFN